MKKIIVTIVLYMLCSGVFALLFYAYAGERKDWEWYEWYFCGFMVITTMLVSILIGIGLIHLGKWAGLFDHLEK
jgi:hypothetical protein